MKILQVHNHYQQQGGEDAVVAAEYELLQDHGHQVIRYLKHNNDVSGLTRLVLLEKTLFNWDTNRELVDLLKAEKPDVIHSHNTFPLISPSLYYAASDARIPVVQTLHNFRLICPGALLMRDGRICEDCVGKTPFRGVLHACYRGDRAASAATAAMLTLHRVLGTWTRKIHTFIALTNFAKKKFVEGGLNAEQIAVKPNFLSRDPGAGKGAGGYALFASRLSREKGLDTLLDAWELLRPSIPLKIAGDGDLKAMVSERAARVLNVEVLGWRSREETITLIQNAALLVVPSNWYEGLPMTIVEAFAAGTPVVTSRLPSMDELVIDDVNGARFHIGSAPDLARCIEKLWDSSQLRREMRHAARSTYEQSFAASKNYELLMSIYSRANEGTYSETKAVAGVSKNFDLPDSLL